VDRITLTGLEVFAHHGALPHEREFGQRFVVDVGLDLDLGPAARSDDLGDTVDYGHLAARVVEVVAGRAADLLEAVAGRVADVCLEDARVAAVEVTIHKPHAPLPVVAREVAVTVRRARP
jgi:7,8-dihydroneopterin aldolase/epimerase/oxygenase